MSERELISFKEFIARSIAMDFDAPCDHDWNRAEKMIVQDFIARSLDSIPDNAFGNPYIFDYVDFMYNQQEWRVMNL